MRLFVGLVPPPAVLDDLEAACAPFRLVRDDLRWTGRELWHLTLAFLGFGHPLTPIFVDS